MNRASVDDQFRLSCDRLNEAFPGQLQSLFTPQHGLWGDAQANMIETSHSWDHRLGVPVHSLYSETRRPTSEMLSGLDALVIDLQDVGTRVYTYIWTLQQCLQACQQSGVRVLVLDRPNPIGGKIIEGPLLQPGYESFVGGASIPMRHGLTIGEMARWLNRALPHPAELEVVELHGWSADDAGWDDKTPWWPPSPNLPRLESTWVYPGQVLLEGVNLSEGRGTTTPFELVGAPWINAIEMAAGLESLRLPGVRFLPSHYRPTFDKFAGELCQGISIHVIQPESFRSYWVTLEILRWVYATYPGQVDWLPPPYEYETIKPPIDIITGSDQVRLRLPTGEPVESLCQVDASDWANQTRDSWLYPREKFVP
ncbi:MAG: DUF1343 domain-containing protein [Planctomycetota bacterium]